MLENSAYKITPLDGKNNDGSLKNAQPRFNCTSIGSGSAVDDDGDEVVEPVRVVSVVGSVEKAEFEGEDDAMREFRVSIELLHVFEPF